MTLKRNSLKILLVMALSIFITSCNSIDYKDDDNLIPRNKTTLTTVSNSDNRYDYVGLEHNIYLDTLNLIIHNIEIENEIDLADNINNLIQISSDYLSFSGFDTVNTASKVYLMLENISNLYFNVIDDSIRMDNETKYQIKDIIKGLITRSSKEDISYENLYNYIVSQERSVIYNDIVVSTNDIESFLKFTSTLRYSLFLWLNNYGIQYANKGIVVAVADALGQMFGNATAITISNCMDKRLKKSNRVVLSIDDNDTPLVNF